MPDQTLREPSKDRRPVRRRPVPAWKLKNSIKYIKMRDKYLRETGKLEKLDQRRWRLRFE
jgi:hypothetical protein